MGSLKLAVLASGRGTDLQALIDASDRGWIESKVVVVVSDNPDAKALERARKRGIPAEAVVPPADLKGEARQKLHEERIAKVLDHYGTEIVVLAGFMRILSPDLVRRYPQRIINVHPALLPSFRGVDAQRQALEWGVRVSGCTTHFVDEKVDHGPIILQAAVSVRRGDTADSLAARILAVEHQLLPRTIHLMEQGRVQLEGRRVRIRPGDSWKALNRVLPDVLYGDGY